MHSMYLILFFFLLHPLSSSPPLYPFSSLSSHFPALDDRLPSKLKYRYYNDLPLIFFIIGTKWASGGRRDMMRKWLKPCINGKKVRFTYEYRFFLGDPSTASPPLSPSSLSTFSQEFSDFNDMVGFEGFPDSDPPTYRDQSYVLDRPSALTLRLAYAVRWVVHRFDPDFVFLLADDAVVHLPLLESRLEDGTEQGDMRGLVMGYFLRSTLDMEYAGINLCDFCHPCSFCLDRTLFNEGCEILGISLAVCYYYSALCTQYKEGGGGFGEEMLECVRRIHLSQVSVSTYFDHRFSPRWPLGMGTVLGRKPAKYLSETADFLKMRGSADLSLGFWLAPLEDLFYFNMAKTKEFHDFPRNNSAFAAECDERRTVLVHRVRPENMEHFNEEECRLDCPPEWDLEEAI